MWVMSLRCLVTWTALSALPALRRCTACLMLVGETCLVSRPGERGELIYALESAEMAFTVVVVEKKGLFGFVCSMLSF